MRLKVPFFNFFGNVQLFSKNVNCFKTVLFFEIVTILFDLSFSKIEFPSEGTQDIMTEPSQTQTIHKLGLKSKRTIPDPKDYSIVKRLIKLLMHVIIGEYT